MGKKEIGFEFKLATKNKPRLQEKSLGVPAIGALYAHRSVFDGKEQKKVKAAAGWE